MQTLRRRTCVMAGATAGDGRATVKALCEGGMNVAIMTHQAEAAESLIKEIEAAGYEGKCRVFESGEDESPAELSPAVYDRIADAYGSVDVVISNTGGPGRIERVEDVDPESFMREMEHLCCGGLRMVQAALPHLKKSRCARVILMSSVEGINGGTLEGFSTAVAKGAVASLAKNLSYRLKEYDITVNAIAKGAIKRVEKVREGDLDAATLSGSIPALRVGDELDLAGITAFLASEESGYMTGQVLIAGNGWIGGL